jgi:hypothetical protein
MTVKTEGDVPASRAARASDKGSARAGTVDQLSRADRVARGKDARAVTPLESHAEFAPAGSRGSGRAAPGAGQEPGAGTLIKVTPSAK